MQECETGTGKDVYVKRVTVRSGGAGHAHSGIVKQQRTLKGNAVAVDARTSSPGRKSKLVTIGS